MWSRMDSVDMARSTLIGILYRSLIVSWRAGAHLPAAGNPQAPATHRSQRPGIATAKITTGRSVFPCWISCTSSRKVTAEAFSLPSVTRDDGR